MEKEKCFDCIYWDKPSDAPENVPFDCTWQPSEEDGYRRPCDVVKIDVGELEEILSRGCEYAATQDVVHQSFLEAMEELGGVGDWDEMAAEDIEGNMCVLQSLFESFYDKTIEKVINVINSFKEEED